MSTNNEQVICYCVDGAQTDNTELKLLRKKLQNTLRSRTTSMTWVDCSNSGMVITENKYIAKIGGSSNWDKAARSDQPLTTGINIVEFTTEKIPPQETYGVHERIIVVGVHPTPNLIPGQCNPGFHVSSVGVKFGAQFFGTLPDELTSNTKWVAEEVVRLEVDFPADQIRIYNNNQLFIVNSDTHKPSTLGGCYVTFMINTRDTRIRILKSSMLWH